MSRYCAIYMPGDGKIDKYGFKTYLEADAYAFSRWCDTCQKMYMDGKTYAPCSGEWEVDKMDWRDYFIWIKRILK